MVRRSWRSAMRQQFLALKCFWLWLRQWARSLNAGYSFIRMIICSNIGTKHRFIVLGRSLSGAHMRWYERLRRRALSVSTKIVTGFVVGAFCCCLETRAESTSNLSNVVTADKILESYVLRAAKKNSFNYNSGVFVNIRYMPGENNEDIMNYISEWYNLYKGQFNFSQVPSKKIIVIAVGRDIIKYAKSGKITGLGSDLKIINERTDYCFVEAWNQKNSEEGSYGEASILIDHTMGGNAKECLLESFVDIFGFYFSLEKFIAANPSYAPSFSGRSISDTQMRAFQIREKCQTSIETANFEACIAGELQHD